MSKKAPKERLIDKTANLFDEFRAQLVPEQGFSAAEFEHRLRATLDLTDQQSLDDAIDELWHDSDQDPVLVYYLDNLKVRRPEVLDSLAEVFHCESYDDPDLPTNRIAYWRSFYENSDFIENVNAHIKTP